MKIKLPIKGVEFEFSREELIKIVERQYDEQFSNTPVIGKLFEVSPLAISQELFKVQRKDRKQEKMRNMIWKAFEAMHKEPERYAKKFYTVIPDYSWLIKNYKVMEKLKCEHKANWVHQAFEWAQRIYNGESWDTVCNYSFSKEWHRFVVWDVRTWIIGTESIITNSDLVSYVDFKNYDCYWDIK